MTALSSGPPDDNIPVTFSWVGILVTAPVAMERKSPILMPFFFANSIPTTHSLLFSENHRPSIPHHGLVLVTPVLNVPPPGRLTSCSAHVPISEVSDQFPPMSKACARISTIGAKATILLRQKIVFSLPTSDSGKYAPAFTV